MWMIRWRALGFFQRLRGRCDYLEFRPELGVGLHAQCDRRPAVAITGSIDGVPHVDRRTCTQHLSPMMISVSFVIDRLMEES